MNDNVIVGLNANLANMNNENKISIGGGVSAIAKKSLHSVKRYNSGIS